MQYLSIKDVCRIIGIGKTKTYELLGNGSLTGIKVGRATRIDADELTKFLENCPSIAQARKTGGASDSVATENFAWSTKARR
jgi:excisionase family DNA binding protein